MSGSEKEGERKRDKFGEFLYVRHFSPFTPAAQVSETLICPHAT